MWPARELVLEPGLELELGGERQTGKEKENGKREKGDKLAFMGLQRVGFRKQTANQRAEDNDGRGEREEEVVLEWRLEAGRVGGEFRSRVGVGVGSGETNKLGEVFGRVVKRFDGDGRKDEGKGAENDDEDDEEETVDGLKEGLKVVLGLQFPDLVSGAG